MAQIAYLLLCHKDPERIVDQARRLTAMGDRVAIHFDARASDDAFGKLQRDLADEPGVVFTRRRKCGWGEWSLVAASLDLLRRAVKAFPAASHFYLISGECMPVKPARYIRERLTGQPRDWIDAAPFATSDFIKTGFRDERLVYRHWFNERTQSRLFYNAYKAQKALGLRRALPRDLTVMIGSQWWCLRRRTVERMLAWLARRPDVVRFFRTTWIPDEIFFQTLIRHLVPSDEIEPRTPTFVDFTDYGQPVTFHDDQFDLLVAEDAFFARKISSKAVELQRRLGELYAAQTREAETDKRLRRLREYLSGQGRVGRRFGPRRWEVGQQIGEGRSLLILVCKKWHVAKRLAARLAAEDGVAATGYLFDEQDADLPDLGGLGDTLKRRQRHRLAFLSALFDVTGARRLAICLDPSRIDVLRDLLTDGTGITVIDIRCDMDDQYLAGHAARVGLLGADAPATVLVNVLPALRSDVAQERRDLHAVAAGRVHVIDEAADQRGNAGTLATALSVDLDTASRILGGSELFAD